jgi:hypothetical protein
MKTEGWGNGGAVEIQGLTASKSFLQLTQDERLFRVRYADIPGTRAGSGNGSGGSSALGSSF